MRISDWSSDVCSSDLNHRRGHRAAGRRASGPHRRHEFVAGQDHALSRAAYPVADGRPPQIARLGTVEGGEAGSIVAGEQGQLAMRRPSLWMREFESRAGEMLGMVARPPHGEDRADRQQHRDGEPDQIGAESLHGFRLTDAANYRLRKAFWGSIGSHWRNIRS